MDPVEGSGQTRCSGSAAVIYTDAGQGEVLNADNTLVADMRQSAGQVRSSNTASIID